MPKPPDNKLGQFIRKEMKRRGYNQAALAERAGLTQQAISLFIIGKRTPDASTCEKLAAALEADPLSLLRLAGHISSEDESFENAVRHLVIRFLPAEVSLEAVDKIVEGCLQVFRDVRFEYGILLDEDHALVETRLAKDDFDYRAIDPLTGRVLTAIYQSGRVFYVTGKLSEMGDERRDPDIFSTLRDGIEWTRLEQEFSLRVWPTVRWSAKTAVGGDNPYVVHAWLPQLGDIAPTDPTYGDTEMAWQFRTVFPDGREIEIVDRLIQHIRFHGERPELHERKLSIVREKELIMASRIASIEESISSGLAIRRPKAVVINPDTQSYMILLDQIEEIGSYWMQEGKLSEMTRRDWPARASGPVQHRNYYLLGGDWARLVLTGGYCIDISGEVPRHAAGMRHNATPHTLLHWEENRQRFLGVAGLDLGYWRQWQVKGKVDEFLGLTTVEEEVVTGSLEDRCEGVLDILERKKAELDQRGIHYVTM